MRLTLVLGPANAGKVATLYDRYLAHIDAGGTALLVVPTAAAVRRTEADLLRRRSVVFGGGVVAFDGLFGRVVRNAGTGRRVLSPVERRLLLGRLPATVALPVLSRSARGPRFVDALGRLFDRLSSGLVEPERFRSACEADGASAEVGALYGAWWRRLDELRAWDAGRMRLEACRLLERSFEAWDDSQLFVQGFEDLSAAQELLVRRVAQRSGVILTLPYEVARPAFTALRGIVERLADGALVEELAPLTDDRPPTLRALERRLFEDRPETPVPAVDPADPVALIEVAGARAEADAVAASVAATLRAGTDPERVAIAVSADLRAYGDLLDGLGQVGVPFAAERREEFGTTPIGAALDRLLAVAWDPHFTREQLFEYLRSPWSGLPRRRVDWAEGRVRARGVLDGPGALEACSETFGHDIVAVARLRAAPEPAAAAGEALRRMVSAAHTLRAPAPTDALIADLRASRVALETLDTLAGRRLRPTPDELRSCLARTRTPAAVDRRGRVLVCDLRGLRGLDLDVVYVVGLEVGGRGRAGGEDALLDERQRDVLGPAVLGVDAGDLERHGLYTAVTRARRRLVLVRRFASEDGRPLEPSPLLDELRRALGRLPDPSRRRLADVTTSVEASPSPRERLRAICRVAASDALRGRRLAEAEGATRRLRRAEEAFSRRTTIRDPLVLEQLRGQTRFSATSLERFVDCSSWWFVERFLDPKEIDGALDARVAGSVAHTALQRFYRAVPATFGKDRLEPADAAGAAALMRRLVPEAMAGQAVPVDRLDARLLAHRLTRDLVAFVRREAERPSALAPTRLEVSFGGASSAPGLKDGLRIGDFHVAGKIDRIDTDPQFSARGLVQDYKSGRAPTAAQILSERRLQIPLYILATRELLGIEPIGGVYRSLSPSLATRGMLDAAHGDVLPQGLARNDLLDSEDFWGRVEEARAEAVHAVDRIRRGDVRHDPRGGSCPGFCPCKVVCRVPRR